MASLKTKYILSQLINEARRRFCSKGDKDDYSERILNSSALVKIIVFNAQA